jgi:hypothetical protein
VGLGDLPDLGQGDDFVMEDGSVVNATVYDNDEVEFLISDIIGGVKDIIGLFHHEKKPKPPKPPPAPKVAQAAGEYVAAQVAASPYNPAPDPYALGFFDPEDYIEGVEEDSVVVYDNCQCGGTCGGCGSGGCSKKYSRLGQVTVYDRDTHKVRVSAPGISKIPPGMRSRLLKDAFRDFETVAGTTIFDRVTVSGSERIEQASRGLDTHRPYARNTTRNYGTGPWALLTSGIAHDSVVGDETQADSY